MANGNPDPRVKIERAKKHIEDLNSTINGFLSGHPYRVVEDSDPNTGKQIHRIYILADIPAEVASIAGDVIHNLRSSLDHLLFRLIPSASWTRQHGFPVAYDSNEYKARSPGKIKGLPQALVHRIDGLKPYKGGNDAIWRMHELNNIDKHRLLLTFAVAHDRKWLDWRYAFMNMWPPGFGLPRRRRIIIPVQDGAILDPISHDPEVDMKEQFAFLIAFNEPQIIEPEPVVPTLLQFADLAESIVALFDDIP